MRLPSKAGLAQVKTKRGLKALMTLSGQMSTTSRSYERTSRQVVPLPGVTAVGALGDAHDHANDGVQVLALDGHLLAAAEGAATGGWCWRRCGLRACEAFDRHEALTELR